MNFFEWIQIGKKTHFLDYNHYLEKKRMCLLSSLRWEGEAGQGWAGGGPRGLLLGKWVVLMSGGSGRKLPAFWPDAPDCSSLCQWEDKTSLKPPGTREQLNLCTTFNVLTNVKSTTPGMTYIIIQWLIGP